MKYVVEVSNVDKSYGKTKVLNNINLKLLSGKIYGIIGRNGSGKSVLMKCICGFVHPDVGEIHVYGRKVGKDVEFAQDVGFIIESPGFLPQYSAYKNLAYFYSIKNKIDKDTIEKYIRLVGLDPHDKKKVGKFSMGMKQRLGIAQAIMESPSLIIVDEPFNGLDISGVQEMRNLFLEMKKEGKTIILVSHNRDDINILCDEVYEMDQGVLKQMY
ncbi:ABC transporter ATP-binding protein [Novisyntrophococcus fermenticellae]|uniref:ABC transporter ATP-binding protein n=1 Tax=Novisyntrophococcus fermenticellae TaxID=2068655 RepID=UPI001E6577CE|nr:ABC transporter ATP-binding protein [Novisyntrophococcus fermenticellae]